MLDYINAHRKAIAAAIMAILLVVFEPDEAEIIAGVIGTIATLLIPNDQAAVDRVYHRRRATPDHGPPGKPDTRRVV